MRKYVLRTLGMAALVCLVATVAVGKWSVRTASKPNIPKILQITTVGLPNGISGQAYGASLTAQGGNTPYTWSIVGGSLPPGLAMSSAGAISGTPCNATATWWTTFQVTDAKQRTAQTSLSILIGAQPLTITTSSLPDGTVGSAYSASMQASGGVPACP